jgi:hypothetical protein
MFGSGKHTSLLTLVLSQLFLLLKSIVKKLVLLGAKLLIFTASHGKLGCLSILVLTFWGEERIYP